LRGRWGLALSLASLVSTTFSNTQAGSTLGEDHHLETHLEVFARARSLEDESQELAAAQHKCRTPLVEIGLIRGQHRACRHLVRGANLFDAPQSHGALHIGHVEHKVGELGIERGLGQKSAAIVQQHAHPNAPQQCACECPQASLQKPLLLVWRPGTSARCLAEPVEANQVKFRRHLQHWRNSPTGCW
jgi:hypothetical protein